MIEDENLSRKLSLSLTKTNYRNCRAPTFSRAKIEYRNYVDDFSSRQNFQRHKHTQPRKQHTHAHQEECKINYINYYIPRRTEKTIPSHLTEEKIKRGKNEN
jgi:hypothetical protein